MKTLLALIIAMLALVAAAAISALVLKPAQSAAKRAALEFMELVRDDRLYDAYRASAAVVRGRSFDAFERGILAGDIAGWKSLDWQSVNHSATEARFQGTLANRTGDEVALTANLVREAGGWRVFALATERTGTLLLEEEEAIVRAEAIVEVPDEDTLRTLVYDTMYKFNEAVQIKYFGPFYQQISTAWQQQTTPAQLDEAFAVFIERGVSFPGIKKEEAEFILPPVITPEGLLDIRGYYPDQPFRVGFELKFILERGRWRLFAINVNLVSPE